MKTVKMRRFVVVSHGWYVAVLDENNRLWESRGAEIPIKEICLDAPKFRFQCDATSVLEALQLFTKEVNRRKSMKEKMSKMTYHAAKNEFRNEKYYP